MMQRTKDNKEKAKKQPHVTKFYKFVTACAVFVMIMAAYATFGYQVREYTAHSYEKGASEVVASTKKVGSQMNIGADLSNIPTDKTIERILNKLIPEVCEYSDDIDTGDDCDVDKPLTCLSKYKINKILVQDTTYKNYLVVELLTGKKDSKVFEMVLDLRNNNKVISFGGEVDDYKCIEYIKDDSIGANADVNLSPGEDPENSYYVNTQPKS